MSRKLHLTISTEPGALPTLCSFPLKLMIVWMTTSALFSLGIKLPELLLRAPLRGLLGLLCPISWPPPNRSLWVISSCWGSCVSWVSARICALARVGDRKVRGRRTWGSGDRHMRSDFQICYVPFSESFLGALIACDHPAPLQQLTPRLGMWCLCRLEAMRNKGWIWLVLKVLVFSCLSVIEKFQHL